MDVVETTLVDGGKSRREYADVPGPGARVLSDCMIVDSETGEPHVAHLPLRSGSASLEPLRQWLRTYQGWDADLPEGSTSSQFRLAGWTNAFSTFGYAARVPMRRRLATSTSRFNLRYPKAAMALEDIAAKTWKVFEAELPDRAGEHSELVADIAPEWRLASGEAPWTSGIINRTSALPYHLDSGNVKDSWSAQLVLRDRVEGGHLHIPNLDVWLACDDLSLAIFNGQQHLHGVTPFQRQPGGYRYSIVFYAKSSIARAGTPAEELEFAQNQATEMAEARTSLEATDGPN